MYRNGMRRVAAAAVVAASLSLVSVAIPATANAAAPAFQLPFPCNQTWHGNSSNSNAHETYEIDFKPWLDTRRRSR